jgi:hypothetical protein
MFSQQEIIWWTLMKSHPPHNTTITFEFAKVRHSNLLFRLEFFEEFCNLIITVWCIDRFTFVNIFMFNIYILSLCQKKIWQSLGNTKELFCFPVGKSRLPHLWSVALFLYIIILPKRKQIKYFYIMYIQTLFCIYFFALIQDWGCGGQGCYFQTNPRVISQISASHECTDTVFMT